jgi:hypothetical protein
MSLENNPLFRALALIVKGSEAHAGDRIRFVHTDVWGNSTIRTGYIRRIQPSPFYNEEIAGVRRAFVTESEAADWWSAPVAWVSADEIVSISKRSALAQAA